MTADALKKLTTDALDTLAALLDEGHSDQLTALLKTMGRFHKYSWHKVALIASQRPTATRVAGFQTWRTMGRFDSEPDMRALLEAVDARHEEDWLVRPTTVRTLLLLLYATGPRISEALALTNADTDLAEAILTIRETKFYKSRLVPIGADLVGVLARYRDQPHKKPGRRPDAPFLIDRDGRRILRQTAELIFKRVREQAGLERPRCRTFQPRLQDFRHTFALNRLVSWYREGKNVQRLLPHLSTYLGHHSVNETQRYLNITAELTMQAGLRFLKYAIPGGPHEDA